MADDERDLADAAVPVPVPPEVQPPIRKLVSRRAALAVLGAGTVAGAGYVAGRRVLGTEEAASRRPLPTTTRPTAGETTLPSTTEAPPAAPGMALWSDPATWGGKVPAAGDVATIGKPIMLDVDAEVAGVAIDGAGELVFDPAKSRTLTSHGNVDVMGALRMRPSSAAVHHVLRFVGVDEGSYVGGHIDEPAASDVGLWAHHTGVLDLMGASKTAWTHLASAVEAGATQLTVDKADGWQAGDEIVVTPSESTVENSEHWMHHDRRVVKAVQGTTVTLDGPLEHPHPFVTVRPGVVQRPEVLNLGRNVRVEGTAEGRAHVMVLHGTVPQKLGWTQLRYLGPEGVLGRYSLHFHMGHDGVRGSTVDGLVALDTANHAFVPHFANGVSFRDCIVHESVDDAYWWDQAGDGQQSDAVQSHDILYERCVASAVRVGADPHSTAAFLMGAGKGNAARGCVAVGSNGRSEGATGFRWSAGSNDETNTWVFEDNVCHNNSHSALFFWQNNAPRTIVDRFTVYHCGQGMYAGSYTNLVSYRDCTIYACADWALTISATPMVPRNSPDETITFEKIYIDQNGNSEYGVSVHEHTLTGDRVTLISESTFKGARKAQVIFPTGGEIRQMYDFVNCTFDGNAFWLAEGVPVDSQIRVLGGNLGNIQVHPPGGPGQARAAWNGSVTSA